MIYIDITAPPAPMGGKNRLVTIIPLREIAGASKEIGKYTINWTSQFINSIVIVLCACLVVVFA